MPGTPYLSALINTYNHERFIGEAIESILAQDFPASEMEIVVVDDGSTDGTREQVLRFGDRVRYIRKENGGQASALNAGFAEARGEIVAMLDSDDLWLPQKARRVVETFAANPQAGLVLHPCATQVQGASSGSDDKSFVPVKGYLPADPASLLRLGGATTSATAIRREIAEQILPAPNDVVLFADSYLIAAGIFIAPVATIAECLTLYRVHGGNLTAFTGPDPVRAKRRYTAFVAAIEATRDFLERSGFSTCHPPASLMLERMKVVAENLEFTVEAPDRARYFAHLRRYHRLYRPLWQGRYRAFHSLLCVAGLVLGYAPFLKAQEFYRSARPLVRARERLAPASQRQAHATALHTEKSPRVSAG
ncbi:MAG TPA: glycosyltransferase family A protein [Candidatus Acidoferrales bacterium]|nr:glycosyltransferase family A protein [Candidatus Acidoferrales bacterium]